MDKEALLLLIVRIRHYLSRIDDLLESLQYKIEYENEPFVMM
jgi:hypothetical protein